MVPGIQAWVSESNRLTWNQQQMEEENLWF